MGENHVCCGKLVETDSRDAIFRRNVTVGVKSSHLLIMPKYVVLDVYLCKSCGDFFYKINPDKSHKGFPKDLILPEDRLIIIKSHKAVVDNAEKTYFKTNRHFELVMS